MASDDLVPVRGKVIGIFKGDLFKVEGENGLVILAKPSGKLRLNKIRIVVGDEVEVGVSTTDLSRGKITRRFDKRGN